MDIPALVMAIVPGRLASAREQARDMTELNDTSEQLHHLVELSSKTGENQDVIIESLQGSALSALSWSFPRDIHPARTGL